MVAGVYAYYETRSFWWLLGGSLSVEVMSFDWFVMGKVNVKIALSVLALLVFYVAELKHSAHVDMKLTMKK